MVALRLLQTWQNIGFSKHINKSNINSQLTYLVNSITLNFVENKYFGTIYHVSKYASVNMQAILNC